MNDPSTARDGGHQPTRRPGQQTALLSIALIASGCTAPLRDESGAKQPPPNIVLIVSDDQGWADIGYNNPAVYSPVLDALAAGGARLDQAYVMPQCTPTRVALLTGRYPGRFGGAALQASNEPALPSGTATLASRLRDTGYATYLCGKWHLGSTPANGPNHFGFDHSYGSLTGAVGMYDHRYREGKFAETWHRDHEIVPGWENGTHATDLVAAEAEAIVRQRGAAANGAGQPFFLYVPFHSVHTPLDERGTFVDRPTQRDPDRPDRWLDEDQIEWFHDPGGVIQRESDPEKRLLLAAVHHLDAAVGRIIDALEQSGQRNNTLIVFTSDNGPQGSWPGNAYPDDLRLTDFNQPSSLRGKKLDVWEGGIRVPAFANWPGHVAPREITDPVHAVDWLPTLLALAGAATNSSALDGMDVGPALFAAQELPQPLPTRELYWTWSRRTDRWALRHGRWKVVAYGRPEPADATAWALFDLAQDPGETTDLAATHPDIALSMHRRFVAQRLRDAR